MPDIHSPDQPPANDQPPTEHRLATLALHQMQAGHPTAAVAAVHALNTHHGPSGVIYALQAWIDALGWATGILRPGEPAPTELTFQLARADNGGANPDDTPPPPVLWAANLISARLRMDRDAFDRLITEPTDSDALGERVFAVLTTTALMCNQHAGRDNTPIIQALSA